MPAQHQPAPHYLPEYNHIPLTTQRPSFEAAPTQEVRAAQHTAAVPGYPQYLAQHHPYSPNFNQPQYPQYHPHHAPPPPLVTAQHHHQHHQHHHHGLPRENWYPSPAPDPSYAPVTAALESTYHTSHASPSPLPPHSFHPNYTHQDASYQPLPPTHHQNPLIELEGYQTLFPSPANHLPLPTSIIPVSPTHSNTASISPSVSPPQYSSRVSAEYAASLPPVHAHAHAHAHAHDDSPRQPNLTSLRHSPSSSTSTAPYPNPPNPNPATHHRMHHSLTCFMGRPADDDINSSMPTAHQYNLQPQATNVFGILTNGCNRSRNAAHGSAAGLYSPYNAFNAPRAPSTSSPSLDQPRPHVCGICQAAFHRNHDLKRHKDVHNDTKPYVCQCGRAFTRKDALKRHMFLKSCGKDKGHESA